MRHLERVLVMLASCLAGGLCCAPARAWGPEGHQTVGAIADRLLAGSTAEGIVRTILAGLRLQQAALWADCAKGVASADGVNFVYSVALDSEGARRFPECAQFENAEEEARQINFVSSNWKQCGAAHDREFCHNQYHYTDVSDLRDHYDETLQGTQKHDVVHAIGAAVAVLRGLPAPAPFKISGRREALLLLSHYVGDIHQPLHVEAVYLDAQGKTVDPDAAGPVDPKTDTNGGNQIFDSGHRLHGEWDAIPAALQVAGTGFEALLLDGRGVPPATGDVAGWSTQWASDTIVAGKPAFQNLVFKLSSGSGASTSAWSVSGIDAAYNTQADALKARQLAKAGAHLAQVLKAIWPDGSAPPAPPAPPDCPPVAQHEPPAGYLLASDLPDITAWLPAAPTRRSAAQAADDDVIHKTRSLLKKARGMQAALDDVFPPDAVAQRFKSVLGVELNRCNAPRLITLIERAQTDADNLVAPVKRLVADGGRKRPFVAQPQLPSCLSPVDLAGQRHNDIDIFHLDKTGSYPSTHALLGQFIGMLFSDLAPDRATAMTAWGLDFGDSRVVCGFHYPSDVSGGRLAASALWSRLLADPVFNDDLLSARIELKVARDR